MEFRIAAEELRKALYRAQGIVEKKATKPALSNVLVTANASTLTVTAFDLDIGVVSEHPAEVMKTGALALSAKTLFDIVQNLPEASLTLRRVDNNFAEISSGSAQFKIVGMSAEEFPKLPQAANANMVKVSGPTLLEMIRKTAFAISNDETRFNLNGVLFESKGEGTTRMVATDGHRLSLIERPLEGNFKLKAGVIIPRKGLFELKRLLDEAPDAECELGFASNSALFQKPGLTMIMRLIDGSFPEYGRVIPKEAEKQVMVSRVRLLECLKRISLLSADKSNAVRVNLTPNLLRITANNPDLGEAKDDIQVSYTGADLSVGFNARYLVDILGVLETDEVVLELGDEHSPGVVHAPGDKSFTAVVMPMRV